MNLTGFGLSIYLSQFVFGVIEIPAKMAMYVLVNRIGRRQSQAWTLILAGVCIGANIIIPKCERLFCSTQDLLKGEGVHLVQCWRRRAVDLSTGNSL